MMKTKTNKKLNLPQLIEWGFDNDVRNECFLTHDSEGNASEVSFDVRGLPKFSSVVDKSDTFTVEEEIEITEDTVIPKTLAMFEHNGNAHIEQHDSKCINEILTLDKKVKGSVTKTIHAMNNDLTLTLIWRDGELVK